MNFILRSGSRNTSFEQITLECGPYNTLEHLVSLLTIRYPTLMADHLEIYYKYKRMIQDKTITQLEIPDGAEFLIKEKTNSCCQLI